jgi:RNA ligase (TIGR02306 family)
MHDEKGKVLEVGDFVTEKLGITYYEPEDNKRKANSVDKYKKMAQRRPDIFKKPWARWMMKRDWGKKVMFLFFGRKRDKKGAWPSWIKKTDEERCQNMPWLFPGGDELFTVTEKIDGTSTTFAIKGHGRKQEFFVCSRNVVQDTPEKENWYEGNVYWEMAEKYNIKDALTTLMDGNTDYIILQGETYGAGIQKRDYSMKDHDFAAFNLIIKRENCEPQRLDWHAMKLTLDHYGIPVVPLVDDAFKIPETCDELLKIAEGNSVIDGKMREGIVIRSKDGQRSFKAVSNNFLLKFHS